MESYYDKGPYDDLVDLLEDIREVHYDDWESFLTQIHEDGEKIMERHAPSPYMSYGISEHGVENDFYDAGFRPSLTEIDLGVIKKEIVKGTRIPSDSQAEYAIEGRDVPGGFMVLRNREGGIVWKFDKRKKETYNP